MSAETLRSIEQLAAIEDDWLDLCRRTPETTPFQTPMWLLPWWASFGSNDLNAIAVRENGRLAALAPLYVIREDDESLGLLLGTGNSDYLDMVGPAEAVIGEMAACDCQMWDLQQLRPSSPLLALPTPDGWSDEISDHDPCPILNIEGAGEGLQNLVSTHFRKKIRYYRRALARSGEVRVESATEENLDELLAALFELHAARWQQRGLPGVLADEVVRGFHRDAARRMLAAGALRMHATRLDGRIVAVFYGFSLNGTVYYYLSGYDPALEKLSIGTVLVAHAIEEAVREGAATFDFLRGAEEYKYAWGAADRMNRRRQWIRGMPPP
jgi:CelD/BcsL family acetyltransferase involved in cellulose biosynthesis